MRSGSGRHPKTNGRARQRPVWVRRVGRGPTTTLLATKRRQWQWGRRGNVTRAGRARRMRRWGGGGAPGESGRAHAHYSTWPLWSRVPSQARTRAVAGGGGAARQTWARPVTRRPTRHSRRVCLCGGLVGKGRRLRRVDPNRKGARSHGGGGGPVGTAAWGRRRWQGTRGWGIEGGSRTRPVSGKISFPLLRPFLVVVVGVKREGVPVQIGPKRFAGEGEAPHWADLGRAALLPRARREGWQNERTDSTRRRSSDCGAGEEMGHRGSPCCSPQYQTTPSLKVA